MIIRYIFSTVIAMLFMLSPLGSMAQKSEVKVYTYSKKDSINDKDTARKKEKEKEKEKGKDKEESNRMFSFSFPDNSFQFDLNQEEFESRMQQFDFDMENLNKSLDTLNIGMDRLYAFSNKSDGQMLKFDFDFNWDGDSGHSLILQKNKDGENVKRNLFDRLSENKKITTIYISKGMLSMASSFAPDMGNIKTKDISKKLDQLEIYTSEDKDACRLIKSEVAALGRNKDCEVLMRIKDGFDDITFYGVKDGDTFREMIMVTIEENECSVIRMLGNFTIADVKKIADGK